MVEGPMAALDDRPRPGREPTITLEAKAWLVLLACRKAKDLGREPTPEELAAELDMTPEKVIEEKSRRHPTVERRLSPDIRAPRQCHGNRVGRAAYLVGCRNGSACSRRHRFPPEIIQHAIWLYVRFTLSYRDVEGIAGPNAGWISPTRRSGTGC